MSGTTVSGTTVSGTTVSLPSRPLGAGWLRLWHWTQGVSFLGLTLSGASMHWADSPWSPLSFGTAVALHNGCGVVALVAWILFAIWNPRSGNLRHYRLRGTGLGAQLWPQIRYYTWGIFHREPDPFPPQPCEKFNPAQRLAYSLVMYLLMPIAVTSGTLLFFPILAPQRALGQPGLLPMAMIHLSAGYLLVAFLILHIYMTQFLHRS